MILGDSRRYVLALFLMACRGSDNAGVTQVDYSVHEVDRIATRLSEEKVEEPLSAELAFLLRGRCPVLRRARYEREKEAPLGILQIWGEGLETIWGIAGVSQDGSIGRAESKREGDGSIRVAVGCSSCEVLLGFRVDEREVACSGPGHSVQISQHRLVH